jgi:hypothetical protein
MFLVSVISLDFYLTKGKKKHDVHFERTKLPLGCCEFLSVVFKLCIFPTIRIENMNESRELNGHRPLRGSPSAGKKIVTIVAPKEVNPDVSTFILQTNHREFEKKVFKSYSDLKDWCSIGHWRMFLFSSFAMIVILI